MLDEKLNVMQRAEKALEYWEEGSLWARLIERDIDANDLQALEFHVNQAAAEQDIQENADLFATHVTDWLITGNPGRKS